MRSKNEILFANLCILKYPNVLLNCKLFDNWDSDVIIPHLRVAVLWNGIYHYKKVKAGHDLEAVQRQDRLKIEAIKRCGYFPYVIKDMGSHNKEFVYEQFEIFSTLYHD